MTEAIIFDLDGVISDTDKMRFSSLTEFLKERNIKLEEKLFKASIGKRTNVFLNEYFSGELALKDITDVCRQVKEKRMSDLQGSILPQPSVVECCKNLSEAGYVLAIGSSSKLIDIKLILNQFNIRKYFSLLVGADLVTKSKPDPETYLTCVKQLDLPKEKCIVVEDSPKGIKAAKGAELLCIAVTYTHDREQLYEADFVVSSLAEITPDFVRESFDRYQ